MDKRIQIDCRDQDKIQVVSFDDGKKNNLSEKNQTHHGPRFLSRKFARTKDPCLPVTPIASNDFVPSAATRRRRSIEKTNKHNKNK